MRVDRRRARRAAHRRRDDHRPRPHRGGGGASSTRGVRPDIVTIGKAFGGGFPLSGAADDRRDLRRRKPWGEPVGVVVELRRQPAGRGGGRGGAADHRRGEAGRERARVGEVMLRELRDARRSLPVRRLRRRRRAVAADRAGARTRRRRSRSPRRVTERIFTEACERGLLTMAYAASFRIQPALTIDEATARNGVAILREVFDVVEREGLWRSLAAPAAAAAAPGVDARSPRIIVAVWFGCGHVPYAPGTGGHDGRDPALSADASATARSAVAAAARLVTPVGIWAAGIVERRLGSKDPQIVCVDEVAGVLVTWIAAPPTTRALVVGVVAVPHVRSDSSPGRRRRAETPQRRRGHRARRRRRRSLGRGGAAPRPRPRLALGRPDRRSLKDARTDGRPDRWLLRRRTVKDTRTDGY